MAFKPLNGRVLVERVRADEVSEGGIYIPETAKEVPMQGTVIALGEGWYENGVFVPTKLKVGDKVLFGRYAGSEIQIDGREQLILLEPDIFGTVD